MSDSDYDFLTLQKAEDGNHKMVASFYNKYTGKIKHIKFGAKGYKDYLYYVRYNGKEVADIHKANYINRHQTRESWQNPLTAGTLSKYLLWNKTSLKASLDDYLKVFF